MRSTKELLQKIYQKTSGYCHLCHSKLALVNYGRAGQRGAWEIEHSIPRSKGGTDHLNNLLPACIDCNRDKSDCTTRTARSRNGKTCAPLSPEKRRQAKTENGILAAIGGGAVGFAVAGPVGAIVGAITGGHLGVSANPDK